MKYGKQIGFFAITSAVLFIAFVSNVNCNVYKFKDVSVPDSIKTVKVNFLENKARYVNPILI